MFYDSAGGRDLQQVGVLWPDRQSAPFSRSVRDRESGVSTMAGSSVKSNSYRKKGVPRGPDRRKRKTVVRERDRHGRFVKLPKPKIRQQNESETQRGEKKSDNLYMRDREKTRDPKTKEQDDKNEKRLKGATQEKRKDESKDEKEEKMREQDVRYRTRMRELKSLGPIGRWVQGLTEEFDELREKDKIKSEASNARNKMAKEDKKEQERASKSKVNETKDESKNMEPRLRVIELDLVRDADRSQDQGTAKTQETRYTQAHMSERKRKSGAARRRYKKMIEKKMREHARQDEQKMKALEKQRQTETDSRVARINKITKMLNAVEEEKENLEIDVEARIQQARVEERKQAEAELKRRLDAYTGDLVSKASADEYFYEMQEEHDSTKQELKQANARVQDLEWQVQQVQREAEDAKRQAAQAKRDDENKPKGKGKGKQDARMQGDWNFGKGKYRQQQRWW